MKTRRRKYFWFPLAMMSCATAVYASWQSFRPALEQANTWTGSQGLAPLRSYMLFFVPFFIAAGVLQDRKGPRFVGVAAGILLGVSGVLSALLWKHPVGLSVSYGFLGSMAAAGIYMTSFATCLKWFPEKRGVVVGALLLGSGVGSFLGFLLVDPLLGSVPAEFATTIPRTFLALGIVSMGFVVGTARACDVPPAGWTQTGEMRSAQAGDSGPAMGNRDYRPGEMIKTRQFFALYGTYFLGTCVGTVAIGLTLPLLKELAEAGPIATAGVGLGFIRTSQGVGRLAWGAASDRMGRTAAAICAFAGYLVACLFLLRNNGIFPMVVTGLCLTGFCYGGYEVIMISATADYYGTRNVGANYGILYTAYAISGLIVPGYFAGILQESKEAGNLAAGYNIIYMTLAGISLVCIALIAMLRSPARKRSPEPS